MILAGREGFCGVFPARVGMNRRAVRVLDLIHSVPRSRGDEPPMGVYLIDDMECSPLAWG